MLRDLQDWNMNEPGNGSNIYFQIFMYFFLHTYVCERKREKEGERESMYMYMYSSAIMLHYN